LVIVADGALHYVPFAALPDPARPGQPLVVEHEIVNLPSASVLALLRKETGQRAPAPREVAILADPVFRLNDPRVHPQTAALSGEPLAEETGVVLRAAKDVGLDGFPRLRYTREEADAIASLVEPGQALKALDFDASKETATSGDLSRYRILHFATHGLLDTKRPELSGLVLSLVDPQGKPRDGFLRLHEIYNLDLPADLVVLSGCETALGKEVRGEGLMALTRGFMYAGSPAVVASLWQIDDRSTGELMKRFYRGMLQQGLSAPAALRKAQVSLWKDKPTEPPYFWAGFVFQGDWESSSTFTRH
jgi:CHAT domain-containing protein